tara:strand:+ start:799 stop:1131 length:333 start_codon:yes stop_codon:yes gene_type:complete
MASSNRTGLGTKKRRSQQVLKTSIDILKEFALWAQEENEDPFMSIRDLYRLTYDEWRVDGKQVSWTQKEFSSLLSAHVRQPLEGFAKLDKSRKVNKHGLREIHYRVIENA